MALILDIFSNLIFAILLPAVVLYFLVMALDVYAPKKLNFRGVPLTTLISLIWPIWLVFIWMASTLFMAHAALYGLSIMPKWISIIMTSAVPLLGVFVLGSIDDLFGSSEDKGLRGHLSELKRGVLTTGTLKLIGIVALSIFLATALGLQLDWSLSRIIIACVVIALASNFLNLFDVRPLRASKVYLILLAISFLCISIEGIGNSTIFKFFLPTGFDSGNSHVAWLAFSDIIGLKLAALGPVIATVYFERREVSMWGDAGANVLGMLAGVIMSVVMPEAALLIMLAIMLVLTILSERFSFTTTIEKVPFLRWLDALGRKY